MATCPPPLTPRYGIKWFLMDGKTELYIILDLSIISHPPNTPWPHCWGSASGTSTGPHVLFTQKTSDHISSFPPSHGPIRQKGWRRAGGFEVLKKTETRTKTNTSAGVEGLGRQKGRLQWERVPEKAADKEMIDVEYRRAAAWAQLECHYGIAVMTHYWACRPPDLTGAVAPVPFLPRLRIETMSRNKGSVWVRFITPEVGVQIRIPPARPGGPSHWSTALLCCRVSAGTFKFYFSLCFCIRVAIFDFLGGNSLKCLLWIKSGLGFVLFY